MEQGPAEMSLRIQPVDGRNHIVDPGVHINQVRVEIMPQEQTAGSAVRQQFQRVVNDELGIVTAVDESNVYRATVRLPSFGVGKDLSNVVALHLSIAVADLFTGQGAGHQPTAFVDFFRRDIDRMHECRGGISRQQGGRLTVSRADFDDDPRFTVAARPPQDLGIAQASVIEVADMLEPVQVVKIKVRTVMPTKSPL